MKTPNSRHLARSARGLFKALLILGLSMTGAPAQQAGTSPVKIFILAGQSNMQGQGNITPVTTPGTLEYITAPANDPGGDYQFIVAPGGGWVERDDVWITDEDDNRGGLTVGYGSTSSTVGPELGFGHHAGDLYEKQILIVKAAWGGKSLAADFRPPSSGGTTGFYYTETLRLVNDAIANLKVYFNDYTVAGGYEIAGFAWHQGWNDRVDNTRSAEYEFNMANLIRDIRSSEYGLGVPDLPFVIATTGMDGTAGYTTVENAQLAMANTTTYPDFEGNVAVIDTRSTYDGLDFWQLVEDSPANQGYHWNRNAKTYVNIGLAMGDAMSLLTPSRCPSRLRATGAPGGGVTLSWQNGSEIPSSVQVLRNTVETATAAPVVPATFSDTSALPGEHDYQLVFTMPGDPCTPLTITFDGAISDPKAIRTVDGVRLAWTNNMAYDAIAIRRDGTLIEPALSGGAESYTDTTPPSSGLVTYSVVPTNGSAAPAEVQISLDGPAPGPAVIYEPFDYETGGLPGKDGGRGWGGAWGTSKGTPPVTATNNTWGALASSGNRVNSQGWSIIHRPIGTSLSDAGLLDDGATLWFSYVMDIFNQNTTNLDFNFALCSDNFINDYSVKSNLQNNSEGIGVGNFRPDIKGAYWGSDGVRVMSDDKITLNGTTNSRVLIVGKIEWGATPTDPETLTLYAPDLDLVLGTPFLDPMTATWPTPIPALDQSLFDRLSIQWKDSQPSIDEIRFGATSADVLPPDTTPPVATDFIPADEADADPSSEVLVFSDLIVTFDENVYAGTGSISIEETGVGTFATYDVATSPELSFDGNVLTINPSSDLATSTAYHVVIDTTAVEDYAGNPFAGVTGTADPNWNFNTNADGVPPTITTLSPADDATGVAFDANLVATFSEPIAAGIGNITILNLTEFTETVIPVDDFQVIIAGNDLTIDPDVDFDPLDDYAVQLDAGVVTDILGNPFAGIVDPDVTTWNFQILPDTTAPVVDTLSPPNMATGVAPFGNLVITFIDQEDIQTGSGNIVIKEAGTDATLQTISVDDPEVTLTGPQEATITFSIPASTSVYVNIDAGAFEDLSGNPFAGISGTSTWTFTTASVAPAGPGAVSIYTAESAGEAITTSLFFQSFDSAPRLSLSHTLTAGSDIEMTAGHHLVIYNSRFDDPNDDGGARSEVQSNLALNNVDLAASWSQGYIRRASNQFETITAGGAIIDVASDGDILNLISHRTDTNGDGVIREPGNTGIQLVKLEDSWDYLRLAGHDGLGTDQAIPNNSTSWTDVTYSQQDELDTGSFDHTSGSGDIILKTAGHYLVLANTYAYETTTADREGFLQKLTLGGTDIVGSQTTVYIRGSESTQEGAATIGMIIETTAADQVLNVEFQLDRGLGGLLVNGERTGITIAKLPDSADYIRLQDTSGGQNMNGATLVYDDDPGSQLEVDSSFTHSTTTLASEVGVNADGDYLFLASQYDNDDEVSRMFYNQGWEVNGNAGFTPYGQTGRYTRLDGSVNKVGNWSGFVTGLQATDYVETATQALGATGNNTATELALQGVNIASLFSAPPASAFDTWAGGFTGLSDADPDLDDDGGTLETGIEWVVGGDPSDGTDDTGLAPTFDNSTDPDYFIFSFRRTDEANLDANTTIAVEYGSDLVDWTTAAHDGTDIIITENDDAADTGIDTVEVKIKRTLATDDKMFARLSVTVATP